MESTIVVITATRILASVQPATMPIISAATMDNAFREVLNGNVSSFLLIAAIRTVSFD